MSVTTESMFLNTSTSCCIQTTNSTTGFNVTETALLLYSNVPLEVLNKTVWIYNAHMVKYLNDKVVLTLIPAIVILALMMIMGLLGNPLAIYFYCLKLKPSSSNVFLATLATSDFLFCFIALPIEIIDLVQFYNFESQFLCKLRYVNYVTNFVSSFILVYIAIDRYRRIILNHKTQISMNKAKVIVAITIVISITLALPVLFLNRVEKLKLKGVKLIVRDCTYIRKFSHRPYIMAYLFFCFALITCMIIILTVLYAIIGRALRKSTKKLKNHAIRACRRSEAFIGEQEEMQAGCDISARKRDSGLRKISIQTSTSTTSDAFEISKSPAIRNSLLVPNDRLSINADLLNQRRHTITLTPQQSQKLQQLDIQTLRRNTKKPSLRQSHSMLNVNDEESMKFNSTEPILTKLSLRQRASTGDILMYKLQATFTRSPSWNPIPKEGSKKSNREKRTRKYTITYITISLVFVLSYIPFLVTSFLQIVNNDYESNVMSPAGLVTFNIFLRSYAIHSVANPIIYGLMNTKFRSMFSNKFSRGK